MLGWVGKGEEGGLKVRDEGGSGGRGRGLLGCSLEPLTLLRVPAPLSLVATPTAASSNNYI